MNQYGASTQKFRDKEFDLVVLITALIISLLGILIIFSAVYSGPKSDDRLWLSQAIRLGIALVGMSVALLINYRILYGFSYILYILGFILLIVVLALPEQSGTRRWFMRGAIQPSEIARIILIITLARYLTDKKESTERFKFFTIGALFLFAYTLMIFLQPSLGYALTLIPIGLAMFYVAGMELGYLLLIIIPGAVAATGTIVILYREWDIKSTEAIIKILIATGIYSFCSVFIYYLISKTRVRNGKKWVGIIMPCIYAGLIFAIVGSGVLKEYQRDRLIAFVSPNSDPSGSGYHIIQSKIAIGSGGLIGQGYLNGNQNRLDFLPAQHTDFIFSVAAEEWGFIGAMVILALYFTLIMNGLKAAARADDMFGTLLATGIVAMIATQVFLNLGVTIGLMPITGVPLPLMSYGGSSLFATFISIGLLLNVRLKR